MIKQINSSSVYGIKNNTQPQPQFKGKEEPSFKGGEGLGMTILNGATSLIQKCEANPMLNVAVLDLSTAIIPRTVIETQTNAFAGFEAFRRESSGLIINCLIPGFIVAGIAKAVQKPIMGGKTNMSDCWANEDTINKVTEYWEKASKLTEALDKNGKPVIFDGKDASSKVKVFNTIKMMLADITSIDGKDVVHFNDAKFNFDESIKELTEEVFSPKSKEAIRAAKKAGQETSLAKIISQTHASENIKIGDVKEYFSQGLGAIVDNTPKILREMIARPELNPADFAKKAKKLVTSKSLMGLGVIIPLAIMAQPINRWITEKTSGKKGAPIYKDFEQSGNQELSAKEKFELGRQKLISAGSMIGVALLSIMKKPDAKMFRELTQFKKIFPSMDQARLISTATFVSRMMASEDKNDLREATVRDIATFSAFYFLGDYVSKGIASILENTVGKKSGFKLINDLDPGEHKGIFKKIAHWTKNTAMKSTEEITSPLGKKMRAVCQLGNIGFSLVVLGLLIPIWNRRKTDKKREEQLKKMSVNVTINK